MELNNETVTKKYHNKRSSKNSWLISITFIVIVGLAIGIYYLLFHRSSTDNSNHNSSPEKISTTFAEGITVDSVNVASMTKEEAQKAIANAQQEKLSSISLMLQYNGYTWIITGDDLNASFNTEEVLSKALQAKRQEEKSPDGKTDTVITQPYETEYALQLNAAKVQAMLDNAAQILNAVPRDATATPDISLAEKFKFTEEVKGRSVDTVTLMSLINQQVETKNFNTITIPVTDVPPNITLAEVKANLTKRTTYHTSFNHSPYNAPNRVHNVRKAVGIISSSPKTVLAPGEQFDINEVLGPRTLAGDWRMAPGYTGGRSEEQPGGGVCQVSTTMYGAALTADLKIVKRTNHSIPVSYAPQGLDATISTGGPEFVFQNSTQHPIYIFIWTTEKKDLYIEIYGEPFEGFDEIKLTSKKIKTLEPSGEELITEDPTKPVGFKEEHITRRVGSVWEAYKIFYLKGMEVGKREKLENSTYKAYSGEMIIGTMETKPTPTPTPKSTEESESPASTETFAP